VIFKEFLDQKENVMSLSVINYRTVVLFSSLIALAGCTDKQNVTDGCHIDSVNNSGDLIVTTKRNSIIQVAGWAFDKLSKQAPESISVNLVSSTGKVSELTKGKTTIARPDVSAAFNAPSVTNAGFVVSTKLESQAPGTYELQILLHFHDRDLVCKSITKSIKIE
jgi:hypothetical protein